MNDRLDTGDVLGFCVFARGSRRVIERSDGGTHVLMKDFVISKLKNEACIGCAYRMEKL